MNKTQITKIDKAAALGVLSGQLESTDIRRVIKKVLTRYDIKSINPMLQSIDVSNVTPSDVNIMECMRLMAEYVTKHAADKHPVYMADVVLENFDVVVKDEGIAYIDPDSKNVDHVVTIPTTMGLLSTNAANTVTGCAATLLSYVTSESETGIDNVFKDSQKNSLMHMPRINGVDVRGALKTNAKSPSVGRDAIYEQLKSDSSLGLLLMGRIFSLTRYHKTVTATKDVCTIIQRRINKQLALAGENLITDEPTGAAPAVFKTSFSFKTTPSLHSIHATRFIIEQTIGSTGGKRGGLTAGYYYMEITPALVKNIMRAKEIIALVNEYKLSRVFLPTTKEYGSMLIRILLKNKITVIGATGRGVDKGLVGYYQTSKFPYLNIIPSPFDKPTWSSKGVVWNDKNVEESLEVLKESGVYTVSCVFITPYVQKILLKDDQFSYFPSLFPHACKLWLCCSPTRYQGGGVDAPAMVDNAIERMARAMFSRVKFPMTRRPFYSSDSVHGLFSRHLIIPKVDRKEKNSLEIYKIDMTEQVEDEDVSKLYAEIKDVYQCIQNSIPEDVSPSLRAQLRCSWVLGIEDERERLERLEFVSKEPGFKEIERMFYSIPIMQEFLEKIERRRDRRRNPDITMPAISNQGGVHHVEPVATAEVEEDDAGDIDPAVYSALLEEMGSGNVVEVEDDVTPKKNK
jgi:hypothetical protein